MEDTQTESNNEKNEEIAEDIETLSQIVEEEVITPEEDSESVELMEDLEVKEEYNIFDILNIISSIKADIKKLSEKLDNLENTMTFLVDSMNELKSIVLFTSHARGKETPIDITKEEKKEVKLIDKIMDDAEDILFSATENELSKAIKIEALIFDLEDLLKDLSEGKLRLPPEKRERLERIYEDLKRESAEFQKKFLSG